MSVFLAYLQRQLFYSKSAHYLPQNQRSMFYKNLYIANLIITNKKAGLLTLREWNAAFKVFTALATLCMVIFLNRIAASLFVIVSMGVLTLFVGENQFCKQPWQVCPLQYKYHLTHRGRKRHHIQSTHSCHRFKKYFLRCLQARQILTRK